MNKNIKLAVAGAVLALSATANAGIIIPAGDWTLDINGNVNAFANFSQAKGSATAVLGGVAVQRDVNNEDRAVGINTGLLPAWLGFTGKTRQNDLDVEFTISMQPGVSNNTVTGDGLVGGEFSSFGNRQTYLSFGDKSWGSIKLGKDLGVFGSDAILNDMTLLGVGAMGQVSGGGGASSGGQYNTTLGGIGTGYIYAAWKGQIAYTTPNFSGFQATVALTNPNQIPATNTSGDFYQVSPLNNMPLYQDRFGMEGKASYSFSADSLNGKIWVSGATYDVTTRISGAATGYTASVGDIGANLNSGNLGLTGYYYRGRGVGTTFLGLLAADGTAKRDSDGGYIQATYVLPTKTKLGLAYGVSNLDRANNTDGVDFVKKNDRFTVGLYHPLTKHINLVAEYNDIESEAHNGTTNESRHGSLGAILFF
jgi:predicted porin